MYKGVTGSGPVAGTRTHGVAGLGTVLTKGLKDELNSLRENWGFKVV